MAQSKVITHQTSNASKKQPTKSVRGELLTNGFKSLRAQGMLNVIRVGEVNVDEYGQSS